MKVPFPIQLFIHFIFVRGVVVDDEHWLYFTIYETKKRSDLHTLISTFLFVIYSGLVQKLSYLFARQYEQSYSGGIHEGKRKIT